jgi:hypothetical protein
MKKNAFCGCNTTHQFVQQSGIPVVLVSAPVSAGVCMHSRHRRGATVGGGALWTWKWTWASLVLNIVVAMIASNSLMMTTVLLGRRELLAAGKELCNHAYLVQFHSFQCI